jgi:CheY-like chemotaxis protein
VSHRILVAEDEADIRDLLRLALEGAGREVRAVDDGQAALDLARAEPPHVLVTDLRMPRMDGLDLIRAFRGEPALRQVPVILFTAYVTSDPRVNEAAQIDGVEVVTKGTIADLREAVARLLQAPASGAA